MTHLMLNSHILLEYIDWKLACSWVRIAVIYKNSVILWRQS